MAPDAIRQEQVKEDKPSWNVDVATIILRVLVGGSLGTFITALNSSDLPKLALGGVVGGGVAPVVLAFTEPFSKKLKQGAGAGGQILVQGGENLIQRWRTSLSAFETRYLDALQTYCYALEVEGFRSNLPSIALKDVYIPLRLNTDRGNVYTQGKINTSIWSFLPKVNTVLRESDKKLAIVADPGYGKTTLTRYLTLSYSCHAYVERGMAKLLPVLLRFREFHVLVQSETDPALEELIFQRIKRLPKCLELPVTQAWLKEQLQRGCCLVMMDGLDEVPVNKRNLISKWANYQIQTYESIFILTSRSHGYDSSLFPGVRQVGILNFTSDQKRSFVENWYRVVMWQQKWKFLFEEDQCSPNGPTLTKEQAKAQSEDEAREAASHLYQQIVANIDINQQLAVNPLLLTVIAATHKAAYALPERRVTLYKKMFGLLLEDRPYHRDTNLTLEDAEKNQSVLQVLALRLMDSGETQFSSEKGSRWVAARLNELESNHYLPPKQFLREIEQVAGLLTGGDSNLYQFVHKTFQEYLVAVELTEGSISPLFVRLHSPEWRVVEDWQEVFSFYAALKSADFLVEAIAAMPEGFKRRKTLELLYRIVKEEKSTIKSFDKRKQLEEWLAGAEFTSTTAAKITLEQRFKEIIKVDELTEITAKPITWGEYQQFLESQNLGQFHSTAQAQTIRPEQLNQPVQGLSYEDHLWFCAWLSTQTSLQQEDILFDYWPSYPQDNEKGGLSANDHFYIIRQRINLKYAKLINYLASASWPEADQETYRLMIKTVGIKEGQEFGENDFNTFPCEDLQILDRLWVKYSAGKWGFSVQSQIWLECGKTETFKNWNKFCDRVGWRKNGGWLVYDELTFDLEKTLAGEFPVNFLFMGWSGDWSIAVPYVVKFLFSRINTCRS